MSIAAKDAINKIMLFQGLDAAALSDLADLAVLVETKSGDTLLEESSQGADVFAIVTGRLDVSLMMPDGKTSEPIATLKEGEIFGESVLLGRNRRIAKVRSRDAALSLRWDGNVLKEYFSKNPEAGYIVMRNLASTVHERLTATNMLLRNTLNRIVEIL